MIEKGNALYSESNNETLNYLKDILNDIIKLKLKIHKINKNWIGINRSYEMIVSRAYDKIKPIQTFFEYVFFKLEKEDCSLNPPLDKEFQIYNKTILAWGKKAQINMVFEELGELIIELSKIVNFIPFKESGESIFSISKKMRNEKNIDFTFTECDLNHLAEEIADSEIMINQLKVIYNLELLVNNWKACKLKRLEQRLESKDKLKNTNKL